MSVEVKSKSAGALLTCKAEYYTITLVAEDAVWSRRVLQEWDRVVYNPIPILSDSQSAIGWAKAEQSPSTRAKHFDSHAYFGRDLETQSQVSLLHVGPEESDAEHLTKPLGMSFYTAYERELDFMIYTRRSDKI